MNYQSTRNANIHATAAEAVLQGLAPDGGLYTMPSLSGIQLNWQAILQMDTLSMAREILSALLPSFSKEEMDALVRAAYDGKFETAELTPTVPVGDDAVLELFRGPTSAFKDVALSMLPRLMTASREKCGVDDAILILTDTSGDTGKAAMEGFADVPQTRIMVFYPKDGVSKVQETQMVTQDGANVGVCAVVGNFDDAQAGVKRIFSDQQMRSTLADRGFFLSSANSINWGRILPQVVYYISAYCDLVRDGGIKMGDKVNFCVPTGNFGDILAGYLAKKLGLPVGKLICASNANNVLTDFIRTGTYDRRRPLLKTTSPSMDILVSSNLERLLFALSGHDDQQVKEYMAQLSATGSYQVSPAIQAKLTKFFAAGCCDDEGTKDTIKKTFEDYGYLCDTHTAVGINVYEKYAEKTGDKTPTVIDSTANPFKFSRSVLDAVEPGASEGLDEFSMVGELARVTKTSCPPQLADLRDKPVRFRDVCDRDSMEKAVFRLLGI